LLPPFTGAAKYFLIKGKIMQVILKRKWFVGGNRYRSNGKFPVEIPSIFRKMLPKDAVVVGEPIVVPKEDASEFVPNEDAQEMASATAYVNPAHETDTDRAFSEAFSEVNEEAKSEVDRFREKLKK